MTSVRLYVIPGSHPARAAELMLHHKGVEYKRTDLPPVLSRFVEPAIEGRPAGELAMRLAPDPPGRIGPAFPSEWLAPLGVAATAS